MDAADVNVLIQNAQKGDINSRHEFIESNKGFIRRISSYICKRGLDWSNDDELSIAIMAFNEAIDNFKPDKGAEFKSYCSMLIKSRLIDYFRKNSNLYISLNSIDEEELSLIESKEAIARYSVSRAAEERCVEIRIFNKELAEYGLSMADLTVNCPKHKDTRKMLFEVAVKSGKDKNIIKSLKKNKMLPIKDVIEITGVKRKFLEQWRKYLIALLIIVSSDEYLYLKEYIDFDEKKVVEG